MAMSASVRRTALALWTPLLGLAYWWGARVLLAAALRSFAVAAPPTLSPWMLPLLGAALMFATSALALRLFGARPALAGLRVDKHWLPYLLLGAALLLPIAKLSDGVAVLLEEGGHCRECSRHLLRGATLGSADALQLLLVGVLVSALCEELMFREIVLLRLRRATSGALAVTTSALAFALCHFTLVAGLQAFLLGLCLGAVRLATSTIAPSVMVHAGFNLALVMIALGFPISVSSAVPERAADLPASWIAASLACAVASVWALLSGTRTPGPCPTRAAFVPTKPPESSD
jgi:membrane protease YdiL (CAAX protease family)